MKKSLEECTHLFELLLQHLYPDGIPDLALKALLFYNEEWRQHHSLEHIDYLAEHWLLVRPELDHTESRTIGHALIWHDVIMNPYSKGNEWRSGVFAQTLTGSLIVGDIITVATSHPVAALDSKDDLIVHDLDLLILSEPPSRYDRYVAETRVEYGLFSDDEWRRGRGYFLNQALSRPIFLHPFFDEHFGRQARWNLERELESIREWS